MSRRTSSSRRTPGRASWKGRPGLATTVLAFAGLAGITAQACLIPLVGDLPALLGVGPEQASWAVTLTLIVGAVATPTCGRLADLLGRGRVLLWCLGAATLGSLLCAVAPGYPLFLTGRALQGAATAVIPLGISVLSELASGAALRRGTALVSATMGVGTAVGVALGAFVAQVANWQGMFLVVGALCGLAAWGVRALLPRRAGDGLGGPFDWWGFCTLSVGLTAFLLAVSRGNTWGWAAPRTWGLLAGGVVTLAVWARIETRTAQPLVDLRATGTRAMGLVNAASVLTGAAMFLHVLVLPVLLQAPADERFGAGFSVLAAGLCLVPAGLAIMACAPVGAWLTGRFGHRASLLAGLAVTVTGYLASVPSLERPWLLVALSALIGAGVGMVFATLPAVMHTLSPPAAVGAANGVNALMRSIGSSLASALAGAIVAATTTASGAVTGFPWLYAMGAACALGAGCVIAGLPGDASWGRGRG
ncbi:MFS transporter [Streptomyces sp. NPDC057580]|uniref:MFS transporter n=1 Tax=Streptomyces sp. NPDC057580 TaxID=3346173 RepID=UPI0036BE604D